MIRREVTGQEVLKRVPQGFLETVIWDMVSLCFQYVFYAIQLRDITSALSNLVTCVYKLCVGVGFQFNFIKSNEFLQRQSFDKRCKSLSDLLSLYPKTWNLRCKIDQTQ